MCINMSLGRQHNNIIHIVDSPAVFNPVLVMNFEFNSITHLINHWRKRSVTLAHFIQIISVELPTQLWISSDGTPNSLALSIKRAKSLPSQLIGDLRWNSGALL